MDNFEDIESLDLLISKYLSGNSTPAEDGELMHWLNASEENRQYYAKCKLAWLQVEFVTNQTSQNKWEQLQSRIENREVESDSFYNLLEESKERSLRILRYAAVIIGLLGLSGIFFYMFNAKRDAITLTQNIIEVPYGSKLNITLPDKSRVWVNSGSKIIYNNTFGIDNRDIKIIGEAYFDVAKNPRIPFIVHAGKIDIRALGTAFNVKAYPEENRVETTLVHGSVEVSKEGQGRDNMILLKPSQKVVINNFEKSALNSNLTADKPVKGETVAEIESQQKEVTIDKEIDIEKETAWKDGKLIFEREPLQTLTVQLMRKYNVVFEFEDDTLRNFKFTGTFYDLTLEQIMAAMRFSAPIDYQIMEKKVILKNKRK